MEVPVEPYMASWLMQHLWIFILILACLTVIACVLEYRYEASEN